MKIALAQIKPFVGNIERNIELHVQFIAKAIQEKSSLIIFPELSLTGYEPALANRVAVDVDDHRLETFQQRSNEGNIVIGVGVPLRLTEGITISLIFFHPHSDKRIYSKQFLHSDEKPFFVPGVNLDDLEVEGVRLGLAICYEISIEEHTRRLMEHGIDIYISSVAKSTTGIHLALGILSAKAQKFSRITMMCNSIGTQDGENCAGLTSIWDEQGKVKEQLDETHEGLLLFDTESKTTRPLYFVDG